MESVLFITGSELSRLRHYQKRWVVGWAVSLLCLLIAAFCLGKVLQDRRAFSEVSKLREQLVAVQQEQQKVTSSYILAWENQQATARAIEEAAGHIKERQAQIDYNRQLGTARVSR